MIHVVMAFLHSRVMLQEINRTFITLIPKVPNPISINDFHPISLCNVLYKIIAHVLVNRLRPILKSVILVFQNAFVPNRLISDNILLAHETVEFIRHKTKGNKSCFALKLDMNKAYDRVKWSAMVSVLEQLGFSPRWVNLIYQCISSVSFSVLVNGSPLKVFLSQLWVASRRSPIALFIYIG